MTKNLLTATAVSLSLIGLTIGAARADVGYSSGSSYGGGYGGGYGGSSGTANAAPATAIPEPASLALLGGGLVALGVIRRRGKKD